MSSPSTPFEAFMKTLDVPAREAIGHLMAEHQRQIDQLQASHAAFQSETTAKLNAQGADVAALKQEVSQALDIDPRHLSRAQLARLARKLNL